MLQKSMRRKLYEYVVEELGHRIIGGTYQPGDTLPNEDALCREFDVSRGVLREATKVLIQKGLIRLRPKVGTQVQSRKHWNLFDADVLIWKLEMGDKFEFLKNVSEVRRILESEAAKFAAERAGEEDILEIQSCYEDMEEALRSETKYDYEQYLEIDMTFHSAILEACHNELLAQIGYTMRQAVHTARQMDIRDIEIQRDSLAFHSAMLTAIINRDPDAAYQAAQELFDQVWRYMPNDGPQ